MRVSGAGAKLVVLPRPSIWTEIGSSFVEIGMVESISRAGAGGRADASKSAEGLERARACNCPDAMPADMQTGCGLLPIAFPTASRLRVDPANAGISTTSAADCKTADYRGAFKIGSRSCSICSGVGETSTSGAPFCARMRIVIPGFCCSPGCTDGPSKPSIVRAACTAAPRLVRCETNSSR
jgi:hypothetical protein